MRGTGITVVITAIRNGDRGLNAGTADTMAAGTDVVASGSTATDAIVPRGAGAEPQWAPASHYTQGF